MTIAAAGLMACSAQSAFDPASVADASGEITRVEPLSWWTGMQTPLQLLIQGENVSVCDVSIEGGAGVRAKAVHKADSPNYLFVDVEVKRNAAPGTYYLVFSRDGQRFKVPYQIATRREGSALRSSFTSADMVYLLMPDRFANGDPSNDATPDTHEKPDREAFFGRHGGDLQGMIDHLDYIADLGATAIWPTPLLLDDEPESSYHGYACCDYYHIDPRFGSNELYREFVAKAHSHELKVIMDIVTNHCGTAHWWMKDLPFGDWIHQFPEYTGTINSFSTNMDPNASKYDLNLQESGWFVPSMPDMNLDNPFTLQYFKQWAVWWIEYADLDGFRVDTYPYNEKNPMSEWCAAVVREYPNFNIVGECWTSSVPQLAYWQGGNPNKDGFDSHLPSIMDFPLQEAICRALPTDSLRWGEGMVRVYDCLSHDFVYHDLQKMMIFVGNHDTERIGDILRKNPDRMKLSMALLATMRGFPQIFSGDEMMFTSRDLRQGHGGLRVDFPGGWPGDEVDLFDPAQRDPVQADLYDYTKRLFQWRKTKPVIHNGQTMHFLERDNTYAYFRYDQTDAVFVFVNNSRGKKQVPWSNYAEIAGGLRDGRNVLTGEMTVVDNTTTVGPRAALVVEFKRK
ncbi:glycoside hydrolase family 13 protein [uncultured Alistipes sp.]|jgi:alpha amylase catalytic region|uniref:glycoside hydrolase family 13 protein n=1 Tax=uncultured Alistipes sp. TaxID=538949 RepID=UPI0025F8391F|nr:glycoside hydrolase family 13 protein [uncultured Alistipes sp.]